MEAKARILIVIVTVGGILASSCLLYGAARYRYNYLQAEGRGLPTVYEYFRGSSKNVQGLLTEGESFTLNGKTLKIISGAMHYFRIHPDLWRDRIKKLRAMGANTLETYIPWQLHEPRQGEFDFGKGDNDMSLFLNIRRYLQIAQEEDLLVLLRPGPYICSEFDFGGLPSWLLRDPEMKVRTDYQPYLNRVQIYFDKLLPLLADMQFTRGGPVIGIQLENEYASFNAISKEYLELLYQLYEFHGFTNNTLMFTSDAAGYGTKGSLPDKVLMTANFYGSANQQFDLLNKMQPNKPKMAMELWVGWFDHWMEELHNDVNPPHELVRSLHDILGRWNGSVNMYMFHGGTNFGFLAGANMHNTPPYYRADVTSYDYCAPLSEAGDYTLKYRLSKTMIEYYQEPKIKRTEMIGESVKTAYPPVKMEKFLSYVDILAQVPQSAKFQGKRPLTMENLEMNDGNGQSYGFVVYRKRENFSGGLLEAGVGPVKDFGLLLVNGKLHQDSYQNSSYWIHSLREFKIRQETPVEPMVVDVLIENMGRVGHGMDEHFRQRKGLGKDAIYKLNGQDITDIEMIALEFKSKWVKKLTNWTSMSNITLPEAPVLVQGTLTINGDATDTFLDMRGWHKGVVFVNGFNIGRYFRMGPQQTLYVPGPLLKKGMNTITIFELFQPANRIVFTNQPNLGPMKGDKEVEMLKRKYKSADSTKNYRKPKLF